MQNEEIQMQRGAGREKSKTTHGAREKGVSEGRKEAKKKEG